MLYFIQQVLNGLHSSAIYALLAFGYALTNGVLRRTDLAYGGIFAFAGQTVILLAVFGYQVLWLTLPATLAFAVIGVFALTWLIADLLARKVFSRLAGRSPNAVPVVTLGVAIALAELTRISAGTRDFWLPPLLATPVTIVSDSVFHATLTVIQLLDCVLAAALILLGGWILARTPFGRSWRAVCQDPEASAMLGVNVSRVFQASVIAGAFVAAAAGVMAAFYFGNIGFGAGLIFGLKVLFITAAGGFASPVQAAAGAAAFGMAEQLYSAWFPLEWRDAIMLGLLVILLVLTRSGRASGRVDARRSCGHTLGHRGRR